ncbi:hypothetical protein [Actinoplanes sp. NPDC051851]|uniref:hypothetical protein n=1 Tax=Actinoplanes sp. NPDC051851 TaxID=3154753 RepID=UPI0034332AFC
MSTVDTVTPRALLQRWPTLLAVAFAGLCLTDTDGGSEYGIILAVAATGYVTVAALGRPRLIWPVTGVLVAGVIAMRVAGADPLLILTAVTALAVLGGLATGGLRRTPLHLLQAPVALLALALAATALRLSPEAGGALVATALLAHAAWDALLWHRRTVLTRSFTEWCGVYDAVLGTGLLLLITLG